MAKSSRGQGSSSGGRGQGAGGRGQGAGGRGRGQGGGGQDSRTTGTAVATGEPGEPIRGELLEKVVKIRRCAAVVKGGRRFSFAALVIVGDGKGRVGIGYGKANEVPPSVEKAFKRGSRSMIEISLDGTTIPHVVRGMSGAAEVVLIPAAPGTGVIAGAAVRAVCEAAGIHDILTKSFGSTNPIGLVKATLQALTSLRTRPEVERLRGVSLT